MEARQPSFTETHTLLPCVARCRSYCGRLSGGHAPSAGGAAALVIPITPSPGAPDDAASPLHRLEHALHPWGAFAIVPLFGFANAGVDLSGMGLETLLAPLPLGIAAGQIGRAHV